MRVAVNQPLNPMLPHNPIYFLTVDIGNVGGFLLDCLPAGLPQLAGQRPPLRQRQGQRPRPPGGIANLSAEGLIFDIIVGAAISVYVFKEAFEILKEARESKASIA